MDQQPRQDTGAALQVLKLIKVFSQPEAQDKKVQVLNEIIKTLKAHFDAKHDPALLQRLQTEEIVIWIRQQIQDPKPQVRMYVIKFLRYLLLDTKILAIYRAKGIHYFIARSLQREYKKPDTRQGPNQQNHIVQEILQALKFTHKWLEKSGVRFPKILGNSLVALAESCDEQLKRYSIVTLRVFALNAPEMCGWCGGIRILIDSAMEPTLSDISDQIVWTLLFLLNDPQARTTIRMYLDLSKWFSIFTEIDPPIDQPRNDRNRTTHNKFEANLMLAKKAIITVLKSWQGLIYLGDERQALRSLVQILRQQIKPAIRNSIYDILKSLLSLGHKENVGVSVANRQQSQDALVGEFKINNLLNNYLVMLIQVLLECDLFKILVELSGLQDNEVSVPAQKFLKELSAMMFNLIPDCHRYTDFLISAANQNDPFLVDLKCWSSEIVNTMGNYAFEGVNRKGRNQITKFLYQCESLYLTCQLGLPTHRINNETVGIIRGQIEQEADDNKFQSLIKQSNVQAQREDFSKWNWVHILDLLENYLNDIGRFQDAIRNKFLKTLLNYYLPSSLQFVKMDWKPDFVQAKCGYLLLKLLLRDKKGRDIIMQPGEGYFRICKSYFSDLVSLLKSDIATIVARQDASFSVSRHSIDNEGRQQHPAQDLLSQNNFHQKMIREYISWIGIFTCTKNGDQILSQNGIFQLLQCYIQQNGARDHILILLLHSLDYAKQSSSREFFQKCLIDGSVALKKSCLDFIRLLYRSELHDFSTWAIQLLIKALEMENEEVGLKALSVIEEVTQDVENTSKFLDKVDLNRLLALCRKSESQLMISLLSHKKGFEKISTELREYLIQEIERWKSEECEKYIEKVEKVMCDALEFVQSEEQQTLYKFPLLQNNNENPNSSIGFVYKMPWGMILNCEGQEIEGQISLTTLIDYPGNTNQFILCGRPDHQIQFNSNSHFVMKLTVTVGKIFVDASFKEVNDPYTVRCDSNDKKNKGQSRDGLLLIDKNGVIFVFEQNDSRLKLQQIKVQVRLGENKNNTMKMPAHIFGELAFTQKGYDQLKSYIGHFIQLIRSTECSFQQKRSALWTIGHIGQSKYGIQMIKEENLIQDLVKMAEQYPVLSLRGTCLYALNMICTTAIGRKELEKFQWISHLNCNSGWLCIPKSINTFFYIRVSLKESHRCYWALQEEYWDKFFKFQNSFKLTAAQKKVIDTIALMSNSLTYREAEKELMSMAKSISTNDVDLFHIVLQMVTFYQFNSQAKNKIFQTFEKLFTHQTINSVMEHSVYQQLQCPEPLII